MTGAILHWALIVALMAVAFGAIIAGGWYRAKHPKYSSTWTRCHKCLKLWLVPNWEVEGFTCPNCRNSKKTPK